jgi:diguanylate cyclase (GGDEF)-like protein
VPLLGLLVRHGRRLVYPRPGRSPAARVCDWFGRAAWLTVAASAIGLALIPGPSGTGPDTGRSTAPAALTAFTAALALVLLGRLAVAMIAWPARRTAAGVLLLAIVLWEIAGSVMTAAPQAELVGFPAPGEGFFLGAYALIAAFLILDTAHQGPQVTVARIREATEATVTVGGAVCLAGLVLLTPVSQRLEGQGVGPLLALLYPLLDLLLASVVLGDLIVRRRRWGRSSASLLAGFVLMAGADTFYGWQLSRGHFDFGVALILTWAIALTLIVAAACGPRPVTDPGGRRQPVSLLIGAALVAMTILALSPPQLRNLYLTGPAVITLLAAGARLVMALREAQGATEAYRLSLTDDLTELPNRRALVARIQAGEPAGSALTLLLLDLDGFKDVNDTLGHVAGDHVLRQIARRMRAHLDDDTLVARLGGDEFAVVLATGQEAAAMRAAARIRDLVAEPMEVQGHTFLMAASVGVAISRHPETRTDLLRRADIAMYQAKATRTGALMYDPDRDEFTTERLKTSEYLRLGIPAGQLRVWYQPQVRAAGGRLAGAEALVRWEHPELGLLPPAAFLGIARQSGLMPLLTETVVDLILADLRAWNRAGARFPVSFNVAPPELLNPALLERLLERIDAAALAPNSLVLEVTEDSLLADPERARLALLEISRHQVEVAIDDYGTGFSSLSYLRDLPVHELKLDQSFIGRIRTDPRSRIIVASTNQMAQGLGLRTVAEGVETAPIAETVRELGIDLLQGYFIARPMPADELLRWTADWELSQTEAQRH